MARTRTRLTALVATSALAVSGCGLLADPSVSTQDEVLDALLALRDGAQVRVTADLALDEGEVRDVLRDDPAAQDLLREAVGGDGAEVDALVADLEEAQAALADHAVLLATGADGSVRMAAEFRSQVWVDVRARTAAAADDDTTQAPRFDLQLQVDWATAAEVLDQPDLLGDLDDAAAQVAPFLGELPELAPVEELVLAFLGGDMVGIGGVLDGDLLGGLGLPRTAPGSSPDLEALDLTPRELAETAWSFRGYRRDGDATLVDATLEVRAVADLVLERLDDDPAAAEAMGLTFDDIEQARAALADLPDQLVDVATVRLDEAGAVREVRTDVLDVLAQLAGAADPDDEDIATAARVAGELEATGLFVVATIEASDPQPSVLGAPTTTVTPEQLADAFGALFLGALGGDLGNGFAPGGLDTDATTQDD